MRGTVGRDRGPARRGPKISHALELSISPNCHLPLASGFRPPTSAPPLFPERVLPQRLMTGDIEEACTRPPPPILLTQTGIGLPDPRPPRRPTNRSGVHPCAIPSSFSPPPSPSPP